MSRHSIRDSHGKFARSPGRRRTSKRRPTAKRSAAKRSGAKRRTASRRPTPTAKKRAPKRLGWLLRLAHKSARVHTARHGHDPERIQAAWHANTVDAPAPRRPTPARRPATSKVVHRRIEIVDVATKRTQ